MLLKHNISVNVSFDQVGSDDTGSRIPLMSRIECKYYLISTSYLAGCRDGAVVRALGSHQCGPCPIPGPGVICGLSLLLVLYSAPRGFSPSTPVFPSPQKPTLLNSNPIQESTDNLNEFL